MRAFTKKRIVEKKREESFMREEFKMDQHNFPSSDNTQRNGQDQPKDYNNERIGFMPSQQTQNRPTERTTQQVFSNMGQLAQEE